MEKQKVVFKAWKEYKGDFVACVGDKDIGCIYKTNNKNNPRVPYREWYECKVFGVGGYCNANDLSQAKETIISQYRNATKYD